MRLIASNLIEHGDMVVNVKIGCTSESIGSSRMEEIKLSCCIVWVEERKEVSCSIIYVEGTKRRKRGI